MVKRLLSANLKIWHLLVVAIVLAISTDTALARPGAAPTGDSSKLTSDSFFPSGSFNMAAARSNSSLTVHSVDGEVEVLRATFTIPSGQSADIAAFFNAEAYKYPNGLCYLKFYLDAIGPVALAPGRLWVADGHVFSGAYPTISAQGYLSRVAAGAHSVVVALQTTGGDCYVDNRSLIVISNRHA